MGDSYFGILKPGVLGCCFVGCFFFTDFRVPVHVCWQTLHRPPPPLSRCLHPPPPHLAAGRADRCCRAAPPAGGSQALVPSAGRRRGEPSLLNRRSAAPAPTAGTPADVAKHTAVSIISSSSGLCRRVSSSLG